MVLCKCPRQETGKDILLAITIVPRRRNAIDGQNSLCSILPLLFPVVYFSFTTVLSACLVRVRLAVPLSI